jgi:hypothetical protein
VAAREELGLHAAAVTHPAGSSRVLLGGRGSLLRVQLADGKGGFTEVAAVDGAGSWRSAVAATVTGPATAVAPVTLAAASPAPQAAAPWSLYRATVTRPDKTVAEQLRIEVGEVKAGGNPALTEVLLASGGDTWTDLMWLDASGSVTFPGTLTVAGVITVLGGAGGGPAGTGSGSAAPATLSALAASEANVLADAQALLNTLTNTDLVATNQGISHAGGAVSYTLRLATSAATAVNSISAYETIIAGGTVLSRKFVAQGVSLQPSSSTDLVVPVTVGGGSSVTVNILAAGVGQDGQPRAATLSFTT